MVNRFSRRVPRPFNGKGQSLQQIVLGKLDIHIGSCTLILYHIQKLTQWIIVRAKIKHLEENIGGKCHNV